MLLPSTPLSRTCNAEVVFEPFLLQLARAIRLIDLIMGNWKALPSCAHDWQNYACQITAHKCWQDKKRAEAETSARKPIVPSELGSRRL